MNVPEYSSSCSGLRPAVSVHQLFLFTWPWGGPSPCSSVQQRSQPPKEVCVQWAEAETWQVVEVVLELLPCFVLTMAVVTRNWTRKVSDFCACPYKCVDVWQGTVEESATPSTEHSSITDLTSSRLFKRVGEQKNNNCKMLCWYLILTTELCFVPSRCSVRG